MSNKFQKMAEWLLKKTNNFLFFRFGECLKIGNNRRKWYFCPLSTAAIESGLSRRKLIDAIKKDGKLCTLAGPGAEELVLSHMRLQGFARNKQEAFMRVWDSQRLMFLPESLQFAAEFADNYDLDYWPDDEKFKKLVHQRLNEFRNGEFKQLSPLSPRGYF